VSGGGGGDGAFQTECRSVRERADRLLGRSQGRRLWRGGTLLIAGKPPVSADLPPVAFKPAE